MIRRAIWLAVGAVLGIIGYRRAGRLARSVFRGRLVLPGRGGAGATPGIGERSVRAVRRPGRRMPGLAVGDFARDVRDGMAEYMDRHAARPGPGLVGQRAPNGPRAIPGNDNPEDGC